MLSLTFAECTMQRSSIVLALTILSAPPLLSQADPTIRTGDSTVVTAIDQQTRIIYDGSGEWVFGFTRANLLDVDRAYGTEVQAGKLRGGFSRIIAGGWNPEGNFGAEFYLANGELIFVYESAGWFAETGTGGWRNFKGIRGWERRAYIRNGEIAYLETTGDAPPVSAARYQASVTRLLRTLQGK